MPAILHQIVFTKKELEEESEVLRNTVSNLIEQLVDLQILVPDSTYAKLAYKYTNILKFIMYLLAKIYNSL